LDAAFAAAVPCVAWLRGNGSLKGSLCSSQTDFGKGVAEIPEGLLGMTAFAPKIPAPTPKKIPKPNMAERGID
jgi:hypothetical protein